LVADNDDDVLSMPCMIYYIMCLQLQLPSSTYFMCSTQLKFCIYFIFVWARTETLISFPNQVWNTLGWLI